MWPAATTLFRLFLVAVAITALRFGTVSAQTAIVKGVVVERGSGEPLNLADTELAGSPRAVSNPRGEFVFPNVKPGRRKLTVKWLGYRDCQTTLEIPSFMPTSGMMLKPAHPMAIVFIETPNGTTCK
jgi:hypothetical protein